VAALADRYSGLLQRAGLEGFAGNDGAYTTALFHWLHHKPSRPGLAHPTQNPPVKQSTDKKASTKLRL
jgi:hypothetical protein